jgi:hypothetical protein
VPLHPQAQVIADLIAAVNSRPITDADPVDVRESYKLATIPYTDVIIWSRGFGGRLPTWARTSVSIRHR